MEESLSNTPQKGQQKVITHEGCFSAEKKILPIEITQSHSSKLSCSDLVTPNSSRLTNLQEQICLPDCLENSREHQEKVFTFNSPYEDEHSSRKLSDMKGEHQEELLSSYFLQRSQMLSNITEQIGEEESQSIPRQTASDVVSSSIEVVYAPNQCNDAFKSPTPKRLDSES